MEKQTFQGYNCDLSQLQKTAGTYFIGRGYRVTNFFKEKTYLVQASKNQLGNKAIFCQIQGVPENFDVTIGVSPKITNINALQPIEKVSLDIKVLLGDPLLERNFLNYFSTQAELKRNTFGLHGSVNSPFMPMPPIWKEREIITEVEVVYCRYCGTKNNARQMNCAKCGAALQ